MKKFVNFLLSQKRAYELAAVVLLGVGCVLAGFALGEVYGFGDLHHNRGWHAGFGVGYNKCVMTMQKRGCPIEYLTPTLDVRPAENRHNFVDLIAHPETSPQDQCMERWDDFFAKCERGAQLPTHTTHGEWPTDRDLK